MTVDQLASRLTGTLLQPGNPGYDEAVRAVSGTGAPDLYVRPVDIDDIQETVQWATDHEVPIVVRGGGHSHWGKMAGGVLIDMASFTEIIVEQDGETALVHVGAGNTWGRVAKTLSPYGLAISSGDTASVGVAGLTLGGGVGWMVRAWGLASDQLVGALIVTPDGVARDVSAEREPELFWALRGGGGGFGVLVELTFAPHELDGVVFAEAEVPDVAAALRGARDAFRHAPDEVTATFMKVPAMDPSAPAGATLSALWAGHDVTAAESAFADIFSGTTPPVVRESAYVDVLQHIEPGGEAPAFIGTNALVADLTDELIEHLATFAKRNNAMVFLRSMGGAFSRIAEDATAIGWREAQWIVIAGAFDTGFSDAERDDVRAQAARIREGALGVNPNFTDEVNPALAELMYSPEAAARLRAVKAEVDPTNVFRRSHLFAS